MKDRDRARNSTSEIKIFDVRPRPLYISRICDAAKTVRTLVDGVGNSHAERIRHPMADVPDASMTFRNFVHINK
jgi:hypothetical protein